MQTKETRVRDAEKALVAMDVHRKGELGEAICENVMKCSGVTYIPLCRIAGGAPMAVAESGKTVLPDFDVAGGGVQAYLDAKVKTQSIRYRRNGQVRHGINLSNYEAYKAMGLLQRKQCGLFLVELLDDVRNWSGAILSESFLGLGDPSSGFNEPTPKVYWPRNRFCTIGTYSADELLEISKGGCRVDMSAVLKTAFAAPPPRCPANEHNDETNWRDEPQPDRRGWIRTVCKKCNAFIGYRPAS
jgi:hypothetical protein